MENKIVAFNYLRTDTFISVYESWPHDKMFGWEKSVHWQGHIGWFHFRIFILFGKWVVRFNKLIIGK